MTDDTTDTTADEAQIDDQQSTDASALAVSSTYKVLGEFAAADGAGVLGKNTASSGTPVGVEGAVPNSSSGYGLSTPHDARVGGTAELAALSGALTGDQKITDLLGPGLTLFSNTLQLALGNGLAFDGSARVEIPTDAIGSTELGNDTVTVAGNSVSLGGSTGLSHGDLNNISSGDHHARPAAGNGLIEDGSNNIDIASGGVGTTELATNFADLSTLFGSPVTPGATIDLAGNDLTDNSGDVTVQSASGFSVTITTGGSNRTLRLGPPADDGNGNEGGGNVVAGHPNNAVKDGAQGVVIAGGGREINNPSNVVYDNYCVVSGGRKNQAGSSGGEQRNAVGATVAGGVDNTASASSATVSGGTGNTASGKDATVAGGTYNKASGKASFAAGNDAETNNKDGAFVWGDSSTYTVQADATDQAVFQAGGGMKVYTDSDTSNNTGAELPSGSGSWSMLSTKTAKSDIEPVDGPDALAAVESLEIATWRYDAEDEAVRHMGPMAEDFYDAFGLGQDERRIANVDADGVALAAIQGLSAELDERDDRIADLDAENEALREENERLRERVAAIEAELGLDGADSAVVAED